ncbi:EamA family transporter [Ponticoccus sp. SC2-23]|uniref:EamA family transporter n=1 Tax=Alexandriicola marinus TaxID=2081710 RepID=UPI000FD85DC9|nr:EamA family transporter [Alexandriicola marinus]MBM1221057.1 EamA family transporter [Ponticoccus sp. SC6-9]MBM1225627.1 EamA family transporter [Ponticoccus sp. SC6-15]MBM1227779.1 EamA family transporter [Ponticoccus sp. SC6-38]MBM1234583.1 EamA family transporter [Ponticoccus sp. SC6-45]MBM1238281.1 EamA family transporter [Ponticoccus sp. SC6-49]MBM1243550.1 EamA family transporter [Ponticoccus sp. SC2-64]MBM1248107.1 EamA family transporter [Ponticoccus sp. SC6-42]MBM1252681.1 EamA 
MSDWLISIAGTAQGASVATMMALMSAFFHAVFGALQKGAHDPWLSRGSIDLSFAVISAPIALFLVPWPDTRMALIIAGAVVVHFFYKLTMARAYERAAYTVVYPVVRGTGPIVTVAAASIIFREHFTAMQWVGVVCLSGGILLLALRNLSEEKVDPRTIKVALAWATLCGVLVAVYTTYDAWGIRQSADPFTFLAWFFLFTSLDFPVIAWLRYRRMADPPRIGPLMARGVIGAVLGWFSFGGVMLATFLDKVGEAAVLRETSTVFAALIGWFILGDNVGPRRLILMCLIALGAVIVELGG